MKRLRRDGLLSKKFFRNVMRNAYFVKIYTTHYALRTTKLGRTIFLQQSWLHQVFIITVILIIVGLALLLPSSAVANEPAAQTAPGQQIYEERCAACHGLEGDGAGPGAERLDPRPRDFRRGWYKIRTTASGQLPTDDDLVRVIANGMPGTTMPGWQGVLNDSEIRAVAAYLKGFSRRFERETPAPVAVGPKIESSPESIARGAEIFAGQAAECVKCHGQAGRGDGPSADELTEDAFGDVIVPADLTMAWLFRGGPTVDDIYMRLKTGLTGSPMPSYADVLTDEQLWDLANYVDSLSPDAAPELETVLLASLVAGPIPDDPDAEVWQAATEYYYPFVGQIMRQPRNFTPSVRGLWVRALYNERELVLLLKWHDRFHDTGAEAGPADALAVQFPAQLPQGNERPYFVFGDPVNPVNLWAWSAATNAVEERNGRGADAVTAQATQNAQGVASFVDGEYNLIIRRALNTGDVEDIQFELNKFIPVAFMAWDGWRGEESAAAAITSWYLLYLEEPAQPIIYAWIPAVMAATVVVEGLVVWLVRRVTRKP
jgi:DMSO reductase family type II enzyme heme b subunit